jgi:hypothetical protein
MPLASREIQAPLDQLFVVAELDAATQPHDTLEKPQIRFAATVATANKPCYGDAGVTSASMITALYCAEPGCPDSCRA